MKENRIEKVVTNQEAGMRLDSAVASLQAAISRTKAGELIKAGEILVDGAVAKVSLKVKEGQVITMPEEVPSELNGTLVAEEIPVDVLYEDEDVLVVNKPKNMVVHPAARQLDRNASERHAWEIRKRGAF